VKTLSSREMNFNKINGNVFFLYTWLELRKVNIVETVSVLIIYARTDVVSIE
jgi:hypothetical protein